MSKNEIQPDVIGVALHVAGELERLGHDYALGGAFALGYWSTPRGTLDVDLTLFLSPAESDAIIQTLQTLDGEFEESEVQRFLKEHGFCRAKCRGVRVDVFFPMNPFYEIARSRRARVNIERQSVYIWDAECLAVFKMMFFREKDFVDIKQMLRNQGSNFDRAWVRQQLVAIFGNRDLRLKRWDEIESESA